MKSSDLRHGDVLLFNWRAHQSFYELVIRLITGSQFVHCAIVQDIGVSDGETPVSGIVLSCILEQHQERRCEPVELYRPDKTCSIICMRPKFEPAEFNPDLVNHAGYNYWAIADSLINHFMHRITLGRWQFKAMLTKLKPELCDCSQLVAQALCDKEWQTCEPDDLIVDKHFDDLGVIDWS